MIDVDRAIAVGNLVLKAVEVLEAAVKTAATAIAAGREQLGTALGELKEMREQLSADRRDADAALEAKFEGR